MLRNINFNHYFRHGRSYKNYRNIATLQIKDSKPETIYTRDDYPPRRCKDTIRDKLIGILGYGPQGRGQALNLRDKGYNVILGLRKGGNSWSKALDDNWDSNQIYEIEEATQRANIIKYLLSDAGQISEWERVKANLNSGDCLYFSHGLSITYPELTNIVPPKNVDVVLVAPKGAGMTVRDKFLEGSGINSSFAVHQDYTGNAKEIALSLAFAIGSGHVFETDFRNEVYSDLTGERCVLMGLIQGAFLAQYNVLRANGHSISESYNETVEEALVSLYPLVKDQGMDWLYQNCSTTAQRGALDWAPRFTEVLQPIIEECYEKVKSGEEVKIIIQKNSDPNYRENLEGELDSLRNQELWLAAKELRKFRT